MQRSPPENALLNIETAAWELFQRLTSEFFLIAGWKQAVRRVGVTVR
ncbi:hypothetical protein JQ633_25125 [Bradyrhizobium tropiciagri]|nr:hypothetical protein [Bradyrhizobium tropiciagri]MBR0873663.1 hypothetical protein [Bradyrhizobium tropiciagri]